jgi:uncharacterized protein (DUF305 family)
MVKALLLVLLLEAVPAIAQHAHEHSPGASAPLAPASTAADYERFASAMDAGMAGMMKDMHAIELSGNADIDFLAMMIPHHVGAVVMARLVLVHGRDPATRRLAEEIIASQTVEIEGMKRRLAALRASQGLDVEQFPALGGTRGPVK